MLSFSEFIQESNIDEARHVFHYGEWGIVRISDGKLIDGNAEPEENFRGNPPTHNDLMIVHNLTFYDVIQYFTPSYERNHLYLRLYRRDSKDIKQCYKAFVNNEKNFPIADYYRFAVEIGYGNFTELHADSFNEMAGKLKTHLQM